MNRWMRRVAFFASLLILAILTYSLAFEPALAQNSFYKGKTIKIVVRSDPGGGYDVYGRLVSRHISKYIPGNPRTIVINMPGAGGIVAANYMANRARRDGTEIAILSRELAISQRLQQIGVNYDVRTLIPIGSAAGETRVFTLRSDLPIKTLGDLKKFPKTVKFSATGPGAGSFQFVKLLEFDGFPVKVITGYSGTPERILAVLRGDVEGTVGTYGSLRNSIDEGQLKAIARLGVAVPVLDLSDARNFLSPEARGLASLMAAPLVAGRPFFTPPGVPPDRVKILREAFQKAMKDPELLAEAKRGRRDISPATAEEMERVYLSILGAPESVVARFKKLAMSN
jgi:tripartite-type tricarboxylate transporter receptor subunit TctC